MPKIAYVAQVGLGLWLSACLTAPSTSDSTPTDPATLPRATDPATPVASPAPATLEGSPVASLRVWLPPDFAPDDSTPGGRVLAEHISQFEQSHPGTAIEIRLKMPSGPGGLLQSLVTAANAAPSALPNVIALQRDDLADAAAMGLVAPLEPLLGPQAPDDYYNFAQAMALVDGVFVGLPFAADARVLVYDSEAYPTPPLTWAELITGTLIFPGAEPSGLTLLNLYLALGGAVADASGRPSLDADILVTVLEFLQAAQDAGDLPLSTLDYPDVASTWQVFRERRATLAVTSARWYLDEYYRVATARATLIPARDAPSLALAEGWSWAIANTAPELHPVSAELLAWLTAPEQLSAWTFAAQVLPPRASAVERWQSERLVPFASYVLTHAQLLPSAEVLAVVGPPLRQALSDVLNRLATPLAAATLAAETVAGQ